MSEPLRLHRAGAAGGTTRGDLWVGEKWCGHIAVADEAWDAIVAALAAPTSPSEPAAKIEELIAGSSLGAALRPIDGQTITVEWLKYCGWQDADIELALAERDHGECDPTPEGWDCSDADGNRLHPLQDEVDDIAALVMFVLERHPSVSVEPVSSTPRVPGSTERPEGISAVRDEWRVTGSTNGPYAIDDGPWERIYQDRVVALGHIRFLRHHPEVSTALDRRTVTTYTTPWEPAEVEETNDAD